MGESQKQGFQLSFNSSLKIDFQGSRDTTDGNLILVRELEPAELPPVTDGEVRDQGVASTQINVVLNWFEELKQRVPAN